MNLKQKRLALLTALFFVHIDLFSTYDNHFSLLEILYEYRASYESLRQFKCQFSIFK